REDGPGVEEMWEDKAREYPDLDTSLRHPMVGHNGIFEDYLDLAVRAVINPEIKCYLEKMEDNGIDLSDKQVREALSNLSIIGLGDKEEDDNGNESSEEEDDGTDTTTLEIEEAISNFYFTESVNKDDDGKETEGSEEDGDGSVTTTNGIIDAVANLRFTGLARNSVANEHFMDKETRDLRESVARLNLKDAPAKTLSDHLLSDEGSEGEWHESFRHTIKEEESDEESKDSVSPAIKEEESDEEGFFSLGMNNIADVEHHPLCPAHQPESEDTDYVPAQQSLRRVSGFLEEEIQSLKEALLKDSREARAIACENWVAARSSQTAAVVEQGSETSVSNSPPGFQSQSAGHNSAPHFVAHCCVHNSPHVFQAIAPGHDPVAAFRVVSYSVPTSHGQIAAHAPACSLYGQTPAHYPVCSFCRQGDTHNLALGFQSVNYRTPYDIAILQGNPFDNNPAPTGTLFSETSGYSTPNAPLVPQLKPVTYVYPPQFDYTFCNLTQDGITARKIIKKAVKRYSNSLAIQKHRSSTGTKIKTEEDGEVKMETIRRHSDSVLERKRARDMDEEAEDASERPRKFSG
ncbi:hypothetical protein V490_09209, partial [Pseudogymnoascus sp. VKM F-3557]